jgi:hypothetical protein
MNDREKIQRRRLELRREFKALYQQVTLILFEEDPIGINFKTNTDEYEPEAGTILPRLRECGTADGVRAVVHDEFVRWFGAEIAGSAEKYTSAAEKIWAAFQNQQRGSE